MTSARLHNARAQRGVATLVVVMVLFFIISLVAAYTNRNLLFEQRTSANQYRSTQSHEAAQAGIEWAVAMLNSGRITTACTPSTSAGDTNFRQRYLTIGANGVISANASASGSVPYLSARCVFNGNGWNCDCPADGTPAPTVPTGAGAFPAYGMRFVSLTGTPPPGVIRLETIACARYDDACLDFNNNEGDEGRTRIGRPGDRTPEHEQARAVARRALDRGDTLLVVGVAARDTIPPAPSQEPSFRPAISSDRSPPAGSPPAAIERPPAPRSSLPARASVARVGYGRMGIVGWKGFTCLAPSCARHPCRGP